LAKLAAGWYFLNGILTPPGPSGGGRNYGPLPPTNWGAAIPINQPGLNAGYLMGRTPAEFAGGTPTQATHYWGQHPYVTDLAHIADYDKLPAAQPWGAQYAAGVGPNRVDINSLINSTLGRGQQLSAYPGPIAPNPAFAIPGQPTMQELINATLAQGAAGAGGPVAPTK